ncbi:TetR family transcriptional regulator [Pontiellaceae bacterium B12219]|nr:TetR family transcriptional regulator [Pontiellaceae bacterium B12219]
MARRTKAEAAETRQQILDTALDIFSKKGFSKTTFVDIAKQIGLTKGAVYWHFKTKTDLLVALIEYSSSRKCLLVMHPDEVEDTVASLRRCYVESARSVLADSSLRKSEFFFHFQIEWSVELLNEVRTGLSELRMDPIRRYTGAIQQLQANGLVDPHTDPEQVATLLSATWVGLMRLVLLGLADEESMPGRLEYNFDLLFKDIAKMEQN